MGIMTFLRERAGFVLIGLIVISIVAFLVSDASRMGGSLLRDSNSDVAVVNGDKISADEYNRRLQAQVEQTKQQYGQASLPPQMMGFVGEQTWNQIISQLLLDKQVEKASLETGTAELTDLVLGKNPDPRVKQTFADRKTGQYDPNTVRNFLRNLDRDTATKRQWLGFESELSKSRAEQKYMNLIQGGVYTTSLEAEESFSVPEKRSISFVQVDYNSLPDSKVNMTDDDLSKYYRDNLYKYQSRENTRSLDYVVFEARPSAEDTAQAKKDINKLVEDFKAAKNDSLFVSLNSESKVPVSFFKKGRIPAGLDSSLIKQTPGTVVGPYFQNGSYRAAKLVAVKEMPDSVRSRHILLVPGKGDQLADIQKRADSLKAQILKGGNFAELAKNLSADKGSAIKGGDLGFVAMGQGLVKPFEDAIFSGKKGDIKVVQTQFGIHIIEITDQKNISPAYEIAQIDKSFAPSSKTIQSTYQKATAFVGSLDAADPGSLAKQARAKGLNVRTAAEVKGGDQSLPGLESARKVVQWAYGKKKDDVSEVIDLNSNFVIAELTDIRKKGNIPLEQIKKQVQADALKFRKGEMLTAQVQEASRQGLDAVSKKYNSPVQKADSLDFNNPLVGKNLEEPALVGAAFGAAAGKVGKPVAGERAVYAFQVNSSIPVAQTGNAKTLRDRIRLNIKQQAPTAALEALKDKASITDNRGKVL